MSSAPRPVRLLAAGGTIAMRGERASPALDAAQLLEQVPPRVLSGGIEAESVLSLPSAQVTLEQARGLAQRAADAAHSGEGVVITTGTDTMEEVAVLCAMLYGGESPIVITGANRPASGPGADGPANLIDAVTVAAAPQAAGLGVVVVFGGEVHAAMTVRKVDSTGPAAFGSPVAGPLGRVVEGRLWFHARPIRPEPISVPRLDARVEIFTASMGDDGALLRRAAEDADGIVVVALGAGHVSAVAMHELRAAAERIPVLVTCRPDRSSMLFSTYGFEGDEGDIRGSGAICVPFLSAAAARTALLCCLGAGLDGERMRSVLAPWDAQPA